MRAIYKNPGIGCLTVSPRPTPFPFGHAGCSLTYNARAAIWHGLRTLRLKPGERVLMPAYHCGSEVDVVLAAGLRPVFYRLDRRLNADLDHIRALAREGCAAIYSIHYFGYPQTAELDDLACALRTKLIKDLALGLYSAGGADCDMTVFSLVKSMALPDGGVLYLAPQWRETATPELRRPPLIRTLAATKPLIAARLGLRRLASRSGKGGEAADPHAMFVPRSGEWTPSPITAGLVAMTDHESNATARRRNYDRLHLRLRANAVNRPLLPPRPVGACPAFFPLWSEEPDAAFRALRQAGIEAVAFWRRPHPAVDLKVFPFERSLRGHVIRLPVHPDLTFADIDRMAETLLDRAEHKNALLETRMPVS